MKQIRIAAAVLNQTPLDWGGNKSNILETIRAARADGAAVLCLPELCITGYGCEDAFLSDATLRTASDVLLEILPETRGIVVSLGLPIVVEGGRYNAVCLVVDAQVLGFVCKQFLANDGIHYEPRWFRPWAPGRRVKLEIGGEVVPVGDLVFDVGGLKIGFEICEDAWVTERPAHRLAQRDVDLILCPSASHFAFGKMTIRHQLAIEGSRIACSGYVYTNLLGNEAGRAIYDGGPVIAADGEAIASGPRFSFQRMQLTSAVINIAAMRAARRDNKPRVALTSPETANDRHPLGAGASAVVSVQCNRAEANLPAWVKSRYAIPEAPACGAEDSKIEPSNFFETSTNVEINSKEEEFTRAVALGLFDYLRKSHSRGFVVSLSGGADSSAVATLVSLMVDLGVKELGAEAFLKRIGQDAPHDKSSQAEQDTRAIVRRLLTCVYQSTRNSSDTTRQAAEQVANALGAQFLLLDVDELVEGYTSRVSEVIGRELTWEEDDIALQNIQARVRSPGVWMLTNLLDALLLSTSNRSEAAVGYATMDGDTSGGLAPIAGIDKAFLRHWLRWMETTGLSGLKPLPVLSVVNTQHPTAELRPLGAGQTDEDDLMPYDVLDAIERAAIRDKLSPLETLRQIETDFENFGQKQLATWIARFFRLWSRNQWKRERYAPSFHLDDENLDPKTWCRFPILSGGFERELAELRAEVFGKNDK